MQNKKLYVLAATIILLMGFSQMASSAMIQFVHMYKDISDTDERFHLSELEAFAAGVTPDELGGSTFDGMPTSTNDLVGSAYGLGTLFPAIGTTTTLEHGGVSTVTDNALQSSGSVWSTANGGQHPHFTLNLGAEYDVTLIRAWPRADTCCSERWRNLHIDLYAADGTTLVASSGIIQPSSGSPGNNSQEIHFQAASIPSPAPFGLLAFGYALLGLMRRRMHLAT